MQLSRSSWHYKMVNRTCDQVDNLSLCVYFWKVVAATAVWMLVAIGAVSLCICMLAATAGLFMAMPGMMVTVGTLGWLGTAIAADSLAKYYLADLERYGKPRPWWGKILFSLNSRNIKTPRYVSLTAAYLKAKKQKICPLIEWVN